MKFTNDQKWMFFVALISILLIFILSSRNEKVIHLQNPKTEIIPLLDTTLLFQKIVIPNRIHHFICFLQSKNIRVHNDYELLLFLSNPSIRQQLANDFQLDSNFLLLHAELVDLVQIGISDIDVQVLHFSLRNYQNPFTGETINLHTLTEADAESILQDIGGWMAGNDNPFLQNYTLSLEEIERWIAIAKDANLNFFADIH